MNCSVGGCTNTASILNPLPLCGLDVLRVVAAHQRALDPDTKLSRMLALAEVHANPRASDAELAARTGWPLEWIRLHRNTGG